MGKTGIQTGLLLAVLACASPCRAESVPVLTADRFSGAPVVFHSLDDGCGQTECVGRGQIWAPMWDLRDTASGAKEQIWEIRAANSGAVAVGSWFDSSQWRIEVFDAGGDLVGTIDPERGREIYELQFCADPGQRFTVRVSQPQPVEFGLHYRMYWRGIEWARTMGPLLSDPEIGFDQRWGDLPARFAAHTWYVDVDGSDTELTLSYEQVVGDATGPIQLLPPGGGPPAFVHPGMPWADDHHWPARYPDCWGPNIERIPPPPPTRECAYFDIFEPVPDPEPGFWGLRIEAACDGEPTTPEPECRPFAAHYILDRHDGGSEWFYLTADSFENPDIQAVAEGSGVCSDVTLDALRSWSNSGGLTYAWYDADGQLIGTDPVQPARLASACESVTLEVTDRCGLRDRDVVVFTDETSPEVLCPDDEAVAVDDSCTGGQTAAATAEDDCELESLEQAPAYPVRVTLSPGECRREVPVRATARDVCGNDAACDWLLSFEDRTPPEIACPEDPDATPDLFEIAADESCRGVFDEPAMATDNCSDAPVTSSPPLPLVLDKPDLDQLRPVRYTARDACGLTDTCSVEVVLRDETAPVIEEVLFDGGCLWPPHHKYVCLEIDQWVRWEDNCTVPGEDGCGGVRALSCTSSQEDETGRGGDGVTRGDCVLENDGERLCLRSERQGGDRSGRTYEVELEATDCSGNRALVTGRLRVPHDRHRGDGSCTREILP